MKKLKLFFACLLMAVLSIGQVWADTPAAVGTTLFSEDFSSYSNTDVPNGSVTTGTGRVVYGSTNVTYTCANGAGSSAGTTKVTTDNSGNLAGGASPELMVGKKGSGTGAAGGSFSVAGIPSGGAQAITVSFKQNKQNLSVSVAGTGYTGSISGKPDAAGERTFDVTVDDGADATFTLTFQAAATSNVRVDDILVTVKTAGEGGAAAPTLTGVTVSGTPTKKEYSAGDNFDPAGLTVTGTYDIGDPATITSGITWTACKTESGTYVALDDEAVALAKDETGIYVKATVSEITSAAFHVTGLTVTEAPTTVTFDYADYKGEGASSPGANYTMVKTQVSIGSTTFYGNNSQAHFYANGTITVTPAAGVTITQIVLTATSADYNGYQSSGTVTASAGSLSHDGVVVTWTGTADEAFTISHNKQIRWTSIVVFYEQGEAPAVDKPTISGETPFLTSTTVTLACSTTGAEIYYTTDGSDPKSGTIGTSFSLTETATVRAIAKLGSDWSAEATPKTFTKIDALTTMDAIFAAAGTAGTTPTQVAITFNNWVVTGVKSSNAYVTDGTKGFIVYTSSHGFQVGDILSGTAVCKVQLYNGSAELTELTASKVTVNTGGSVSPVVLDAEGIADLTGVNTGSVIKISGECSEESSKFYIGGVQLYNSLYSFSVSAGTSYECTGIYVLFNSTKEILPRSADDIVVSSGISVTSIDLTESTASVEAGETVTLHASVEPSTATNKTIVWSVQSGSEYASVADGVVTGLAAGTAVIRAASDENASIYEECTVTVTAADPTKHKVTFDATVDKGESPLSKSNITFSCSNGVLNNESEYRLYKNSTTTLACSVGNITKIEFTGVSGNPVSGFGDPEVGTLVTDGNNGVWTGNAASVSFVASGAQVRATEITVTYKEDNRDESELAWSTDAVELTVGNAFTAPTLSNPNKIDASAITIASNNPDLAVVNDGVVSLVSEATGEATITATFAGNETYKPAEVSYTITVNAASPVLTDYYEKVTSGAVAEGTYLIVYEEGSLAFNGGLATLDAESNTIAVDITSDNKIAVTSATEAATFYIDPTAGTVKSASGNFIGVGSWSNGLKQDKEYAHNVLEIDGDGNAQIGIYNADWNTTGGTMRLQYNKSSGQTRFRYYKNGGQQSIALYKLHNEVIKPEAGLAWDPAEDITLTVGEELTAPELQNPNNIDAAEITIASSNEAVATINNSGEVELVADATGWTIISATFDGNASYKPATVSYKITVNPAHSIYVSPSLNVNFGSVAKDATVDDKVITVTLTGVDAATATLGGTNPEAFSISPAALTASGDITISVASTATASEYSAKLTISDDAGVAESKVVNISLTVTDPAAEETPISTSTKWVAATAADLVDGAEVIITGVKAEVVYAMGEQKSTNRAAYVATVDGEGVLTPGEGTMAFTLVAQGDGTYALRTSDGKYLYAAKSDANHLKTQDEVDANAKWTLSVTSAVAEGSSNRNVMQFNGSGTNKLFACYASASQEDIKFYVPKPVVTYVAQIGETMYESLPAAVAAAQDGQTVNLLMDVAAGPGVMITSAEHKQIIIDFGNHTYCATSAGTENQAFHFEKGCNITLQNGTITSSGNEIIMLIKNYGDLTLLNITLIGDNLPGEHRYVLSNNCGTVVIGAGTTITAKEGDVAFDVCVTNEYPEGTTVTVKEGATITGIVEYHVLGSRPAENNATLTIEDGNFDITWNVEPALAEDAKDNINVEGGIFNAEVPADYCAHGYIPVDNGSGQYGVYYAGYYERGSLTPGNYATICLPYAGKISGAKLYDLEYYDGANTLYLLEVNGNAMVAGRPYIFLPSSDKIEVTYTDNAGAEAGTYNGLVGSLSLVAEVITANAGNYILVNNAYYLVNSLAYVGANRAYIHMADVPTEPSTPQVGQAPRRRVVMTVHGEQTATGFENINASEKPMKLMIDGNIYILRGEKMYDATGRLVK